MFDKQYRAKIKILEEELNRAKDTHTWDLETIGILRALVLEQAQKIAGLYRVNQDLLSGAIQWFDNEGSLHSAKENNEG
jgi:hypothetical protein